MALECLPIEASSNLSKQNDNLSIPFFFRFVFVLIISAESPKSFALLKTSLHGPWEKLESNEKFAELFDI